MVDLRDASNFCARYAVAGVIFMIMVSVMLSYQPFFIGGIEDIEQARRNANGGVGSFLFVFLLSTSYLVFDSLRGGGNGKTRGEARHSRGDEYEAVATSGIGGPDLMLETMESTPIAEAQFT